MQVNLDSRADLGQYGQWVGIGLIDRAKTTKNAMFYSVPER